jgi:hypothetical protein
MYITEALLDFMKYGSNERVSFVRSLFFGEVQ